MTRRVSPYVVPGIIDPESPLRSREEDIKGSKASKAMFGTILYTASELSGVEIAGIRGQDKHEDKRVVRHVVIYYACYYTSLRLTAIGHLIRSPYLKPMNHASVIHAREAVKDALTNKADTSSYAVSVRELCARLDKTLKISNTSK